MKQQVLTVGRLFSALLPLLATQTAATRLHAEEPGREKVSVSKRLPPPRPAALTSPAAPAPPQPQAAPAARAMTVPSGSGEAGCIGALKAVAGHRLRTADGAVNAGKDAACQVTEPVVVEALAVRGPDGPLSIALDPPVTLSCSMAKAVANWLDTSLQPLARGHFGRDLATLRVGGGHECRRRNRTTAGPVSEHATGKALDIFAFTFAGERPASRLSVEKPEGLAQNRFLEAVRQSACGAFSTSIGPGADAAHANHLHLDIQERRSPATRFCQ